MYPLIFTFLFIYLMFLQFSFLFFSSQGSGTKRESYVKKIKTKYDIFQVLTKTREFCCLKDNTNNSRSTHLKIKKIHFTAKLL